MTTFEYNFNQLTNAMKRVSDLLAFQTAPHVGEMLAYDGAQEEALYALCYWYESILSTLYVMPEESVVKNLIKEIEMRKRYEVLSLAETQLEVFGKFKQGAYEHTDLGWLRDWLRPFMDAAEVA